jgi:hypothetical protein
VHRVRRGLARTGRRDVRRSRAGGRHRVDEPLARASNGTRCTGSAPLLLQA